MLAFSVLLATTLAGMLNANWWAIPVGACILTLVLIGEHRRVYSNHHVGHHSDEPILELSSFANGSAAALLAFASGRGIDWLWGMN